MAQKTIYTCDIHPTNGNTNEIKGMMHKIEMKTIHQGQEASVTIDACGECKNRLFPVSG